MVGAATATTIPVEFAAALKLSEEIRKQLPEGNALPDYLNVD
jgi:hypothetical protein